MRELWVSVLCTARMHTHVSAWSTKLSCFPGSCVPAWAAQGRLSPGEGSRAHSELRGQLSALCCSRGAETLPSCHPFAHPKGLSDLPAASSSRSVCQAPTSPSRSRGAKCYKRYHCGIGEDVDSAYLRNSQRGDFLIHIRPRTSILQLHTGL